VYTYPSLCVGDALQKNTTQIETTQCELGFSKPCKVQRWVPGLQKYYFLKRKLSKVIIKKKTKKTFHFVTYYYLKQNRFFNYILNYEK